MRFILLKLDPSELLCKNMRTITYKGKKVGKVTSKDGRHTV